MATEQGTLVKIMRVDPSVKLKINEEEQDMAGEVLRWSKRCFDPFEDEFTMSRDFFHVMIERSLHCELDHSFPGESEYL